MREDERARVEFYQVASHFVTTNKYINNIIVEFFLYDDEEKRGYKSE